MKRAIVVAMTVILCAASPHQAQLNWPTGGEGQIGGMTALSGTHAILTTVPFITRDGRAIGALTEQISYGETGGLDGRTVSWSITGNSASYTPAVIDLGIGPTILVQGTSVPGPSKLTAATDDASISVPIYNYRVVDVGCSENGVLGGISFESDGTYRAQVNPAESDLYITGPSCRGAFRSAGSFYIHAPFGATILDISPWSRGGVNLTFFDVTPGIWRAQFTVLDEAEFEKLHEPCDGPPPTSIGSNQGPPCSVVTRDILVLRTRTGALVKMDLDVHGGTTVSIQNLAGAYEVTNGGGVFPYEQHL